MKIELLYFDGCPLGQEGLENLKAALAAEGLDYPVGLIKMLDEVNAERLKFLGSPSFRIDGVELRDEARENYALRCRIYRTPQGMRGSPTVDMLRDALRSGLLSPEFIFVPGWPFYR